MARESLGPIQLSGLSLGEVNDALRQLVERIDALAGIRGAVEIHDAVQVTGATISGALTHTGTTAGFFGATPAARADAYAPTNVATTRAYDADATTLAELADVVGSLIADFQTLGLLQ